MKAEPKSRVWRRARVVLCALSFISGLLAPFLLAGQAALFTGFAGVFIAAFSFLAMIVFVPVSIVAVVAFQTLNPLQMRPWTRPRWDACFLNPQDPLQSFHAAGHAALWAGLAWSVTGLFYSPIMALQGLACFCGGVSALLGVKLCTILFHDRFERTESTPPTGVEAIPYSDRPPDNHFGTLQRLRRK